MKKLKILLFPVLTVFFVLMAWVFGGKDLKIIRNGLITEGRVTGLIRCFDGTSCDLILDLVNTISLLQADGTAVEAVVDMDGLQSMALTANGVTSLVPVDELSGDMKMLAEKITTVKNGKADAIKRFLEREEAEGSDHRIVKVVRSEEAKILQDIGIAPATVTVDEEGRIVEVSAGHDIKKATDAVSLITRISFTFIGGTEEARQLKTSVRRETARTLAGVPLDHESEDFLMYEKNYRYVFRPVVTFEAGGAPVAALGRIGARRSPRGGHGLGDSVTIACLPEDPSQISFISDFSTLKSMSPLDAVNRFFELTFGFWFFPAVSLVVAFVYLIMSIVTVSLAIQQPRTENADTVDTSRL